MVRSIAGILTLVILGLAPTAGSAQDARPRACLAEHYDRYAMAQRAYQATIERLVVEADSGVRELAALARAEQVAQVNARQRAVEFLLEFGRSQLRLQLSANQWLDWGPEEARQIALLDTTFARLHQRSTEARKRVAGHPGWPRVRQAVSLVRDHPDHAAAMQGVLSASRAAPRC